jgi:hypothetical protein
MAVSQTDNDGLSKRRPGFNPRVFHVGFVVDSVLLQQVFSENFVTFLAKYYSTNVPCASPTNRADEMHFS